MQSDEQRYTFDRVVRMGLSALGIVILLLLLRYLADVLIPFAVAVVLAYILNPLVTIFEHRLKSRAYAVAFTLGGLVIVGFSLILIIVPLFFSQLSRFQNSIGMLRADLTASIEAAAPSPATVPTTNRADGDMPMGLTELRQGWEAYRRSAGTASRSARLRQLRERVSGTLVGRVIDDAVAFVKAEHFREEILPDVLRRLFAGGVTIVNFAVQVALGLVGLILIAIYLFFLLLDFPDYARNWQTFLPPKHRDRIVAFLKEFDVAMRRYFRGQFIVALLTAILFSTGFSLIGLPLAVPFGLFIGLLNMVPYLQSVALVPAAFLAIVRAIENNGSIGASLGLVALVWIIIQALQDGLITPRVMGRATGLRPLAILLGVFIWGKLLGFLGLILAIPLTCLGIAYYRRHVLQHSLEATSLVQSPTA